jgi:hypothetical protein
MPRLCTLNVPNLAFKFFTLTRATSEFLSLTKHAQFQITEIEDYGFMIAVLAPMSASMNGNQRGDPKLGVARMVGAIKGRVWQREEHFLGECLSDAMRSRLTGRYAGRL